jgi:pyrroloquinoline-quinone synthase
VGSIISNCSEPEVIVYEVANLMSEVVRDDQGGDSHYELLIRLGESVGLERSAVESHAALPGAEDLFQWLWSKARDSDWLVGFAAVNGLEILGDRNLPDRYELAVGTGLSPEPYSRSLGLSPRELEFFEVSDKADAGHGGDTVAILARFTPASREDEILAILDEAFARLRGMMEEVWDLAQSIEAGSIAAGPEERS